MCKTLFTLSLLPVLFGGCITKNYYCKCGEGCKCAEAPVIQSDEPIVSPDKIDNTKQEDGAPQYPNIKPWYIPGK